MSIIREYEGDDGNYIEIAEGDARVVFALDNGRNGPATLVRFEKGGRGPLDFAIPANEAEISRIAERHGVVW